MPIADAQAVMGETMAAYLARVAWRFELPTVLTVNGEFYSRAEWETRALAANDQVEFISRPLGGGRGGSVGKSILSVVALVALTAAAGPAGPLGAALATSLGSFGGAVASAAIVGAGALAISHFLAPKAAGKTNSTDALHSFGLQGNAARPMQPIPVLNGRRKFAPDTPRRTTRTASATPSPTMETALTALHAYVRESAVHLLTNGWLRGPEGQVFGTAQKVRILGHLPAVVSGRGPSELPEYFADRARWRFVSFDEAVSNMHETYTIALAQFGAADPQARTRPNMILMAGWSEARGQPECWVVDSGNEAAGAQQIMNTCAPSSPELMGHLGVMGLTGGMASFDPLHDGLRIMRAQRDLRFPHPVSGEMQPAVGGFCQHTVVTADGITTRVVER